MMEAVVVGVGSIGSRHITNLKKLGVESIYLYDPVKGVGTKDWWKQVAGRIVVIASPTKYHAEQVQLALKHGATGVYVEKPAACSGAELAATVLEGGAVKVATGYNWRFSPLAEELRGLQKTHGPFQHLAYIGSNDVTNWRGYGPEYYAIDSVGGGALLTSLSHTVDLVLHIMGPSRFVTAACGHDAAFSGVDTSWMIELMHQDARTSTLSFMWTDRQPMVNKWFGVLENGRMMATTGDPRYWPEGTDMHLECMRAFVSWVDGGEPGNLCTLQQSFETMHALDLIREVATGVLTEEQLRTLRGID